VESTGVRGLGRCSRRVHAEESRVLGDEVDFLHAFLDELARFGDDALHGSAAVAAPDLRNDAEGARVVAPLGNFNVREMARGESETGCVVVRDISRTRGHETLRGGLRGPLLGVKAFDDRGDFRDLVETDERIDLVVERGREVLREPLGHAAGDDELLFFAAFLHAAVLVDLQNMSDRLLFGGIDEGAGVDDDDVGLLRFGNDCHAGLMQMADHDLAIDEIFGATEGNETDGNHERAGAGTVARKSKTAAGAAVRSTP